MIKLPEKSLSYWMDSAKFKSYPKLQNDIEVDVAIIGGGITGLTSGYLLKSEGLKVAILEVDKVTAGTTGHTTAKLTIQHDLIYNKIFKNFGKEMAEIYAAANKKGQEFLVNLVREKNIDCELELQNSYVYTQSDQYIKQIQDETECAKALNIKAKYETKLNLPFDIKAAVCFEDQYQFHPLKYLSFLCKELETEEQTIYEDTEVIDLETEPEGGRKVMLLTNSGAKVRCDYVIMACHFPFQRLSGLYPIKMYADKSYVMVAKPVKDFQGGMYKNAEKPSRSLRSVNINGERAVFFSGEEHKTGTETDTMKHFENLITFAKDTYGLKEILYRWSTQDLVPLDEIPYIGNLSRAYENIFVATGYNKWGMTTSQMAALLLRDKIVKKHSPWEELFRPSRFNLQASILNLLKNTGGVINNLIIRKITPTVDFLSELEKNEGKVVVYNGERLGAYRDNEGLVHIVDTACSHLKCELQWNDAEKTWDCPCHGSRFSIDGEVIEGPALERLKSGIVPREEEF